MPTKLIPETILELGSEGANYIASAQDKTTRLIIAGKLRGLNFMIHDFVPDGNSSLEHKPKLCNACRFLAELEAE